MLDRAGNMRDKRESMRGSTNSKLNPDDSIVRLRILSNPVVSNETERARAHLQICTKMLNLLPIDFSLRIKASRMQR